MSFVRGTVASFQWADYLTFGLILVCSCSVGIFHCIRDRQLKRNTLEDFLMAGRKMSVLPVSISLFVSWLSAISFIGDPVEVYYYGLMYWVVGLGYILALPLIAHLFAAKYHSMKMYSAFEYLEKRFNRTLRILGSVVQGLSGGLYCGFVLYGPALCLAQVSTIDVWVAILCIGAICIFYTTLGGMRAVLWADTAQSVIMLTGLIMIIVRGSIVVGGIDKIWDTAVATGRTDMNLKFDPTIRSTVWTYLVAGFFDIFCFYGSYQTFIQRYGTLRTAEDAKLAVYLNIPIYAIFVTLTALIGLVMVAYFDGCDPVTTGMVQKKDQMVPLIVLEILHFIPGMPGLFIGAVLSASLSTLSSYLNSTVITLLKDIVEPAYKSLTNKTMSPRVELVLSKMFCVALGMSFIGVALLMSSLENLSLFAFTRAVMGLWQGPIAAMFVLGVLFTFVDTKACVTGVLVGSIMNTWWFMGSFLTGIGPSGEPLPVHTNSCMVFNTSRHENVTIELHTATTVPFQATISDENDESGYSVISLYKLSPILYTCTGFCITAIVAIVIGLISECIVRRKQRKQTSLNSKKCEPHDVTESML